MEIIKSLITRLRHSGIVLLIGILLIVYIALGVLYWQQGSQQRGLDEQITKLGLVVSRPPASGEPLQAEYNNVSGNLSLITDSRGAIAMLVGIAEKSGIDTSGEGNKFSVPPAMLSQAQVGGGTYQLLSFRNIHVQGDYDKVMAFLSDLDSGKTLKTMVLRKVAFSQTEFTPTGEEGNRRAEFRQVASAVLTMMADNGLSVIPKPMSFAGGVATNLMGDNSSAAEAVKGFPDVNTTVVEKHYTGDGSPRGGYVLYNHDKISADNSSAFTTVSYIGVLSTKYYYTCEANGIVRQFSGASVATAVEYIGTEETKIETIASVDVDIYTKPTESK